MRKSKNFADVAQTGGDSSGVASQKKNPRVGNFGQIFTPKLLARKLSVDGVLEELGLSNFFKSSRLVHAALKIFFRTDRMQLPARIELLQRLDKDFFAYENIFPTAASSLIQAVEPHSTNIKREICLDIFYRRLTDPRFGKVTRNFFVVGSAPRSGKLFSSSLRQLPTTGNGVIAKSFDFGTSNGRRNHERDNKNPRHFDGEIFL